MILGLLATLLGHVEAAWAGSDAIERAPTEMADATFEGVPESPSDAFSQLGLQSVSSSQDATAGALAVQEAPANANIVVRVLSPGTDLMLEQQNANGAGAASANGSSVDQAATERVHEEEPQDPTSDHEQYQPGDITPKQVKEGDLSREERPSVAQAVTHDQSGEAEAVALQFAPANIYISVRVFSPGDSGPVIQVNGNSATSTATNAAHIHQSVESQQESGPDRPLTEQGPADDSVSVGSDSADLIDADLHTSDGVVDKSAAQDPAATNVGSAESETEPGVDLDQSLTREAEQYYVQPDQYQDLISDLVTDSGLEALIDHDLEVPTDIEVVLGWISSWNWEGLVGQMVESIPESDTGVLITDVDEALGDLVGDLEIPIVPAAEIDKAPSSRSEPEPTAERRPDPGSARPEPPREPSVVIKQAAANKPEAAAASPASGNARTEGEGRPIFPVVSGERSIVLLEANAQSTEPSASQSWLPRIGLPRLPSELLTQVGSAGGAGSASPPAVLPQVVVGLGTAGAFLLLQLALSTWRARGLVLPLERPG